MSRTVWRIAMFLGLSATMIGSCRWLQQTPTFSIARAIIIILIIPLGYVLDKRYQKPYRAYALIIVIAVWWIVIRRAASMTLPMDIVLMYALILAIMLLGRMMRPYRLRVIPLVGILLLGGIASIPRHPIQLSPTSITDRLPRVHIERKRQSDDESVFIIDSKSKRTMRSGQSIELSDDTFTIQYASTQPHQNDLIIALNTLTTLALEPQSVVLLSYQDGQRSGSVQGTVRGYGRTIGGATIATDNTLADYHQKLLYYAKKKADEIRPSSRTHTALGTYILYAKLRLLEKIDSTHTDDSQALTQYQCLVYGKKCQNLASDREKNSLHLARRDDQLQSTIHKRRSSLKAYFLP